MMNSICKGNIGLTKVIDDLVSNQQCEVFTPLSEHSKVDLIAHKHNELYRL